ncbi:MAG TPA: hypothetical protein VMB74_02245 [Streptosporangiaceae bacterium]|nr:hypothetical protein [Streptosporangiaceae bacterium]
MPENVSIAYRGANFAIGQGPQFYGIWHAAAPQGAPLEWWPLTPEGWTAAWSRFASIEVPGTIVPVTVSAPASVASAPGQTSTSMETAASPVAADDATAVAADTVATQAVSARAVDDGIDPQYGQVVEGPAHPARMAGKSRIGAALLAVGVLLGIIGLFPDYFTGASLASEPAELVPHIIYLAAWAGSTVLILLGGARSQAGALIAVGVSAVTFGMFFADLGSPIAYGASVVGAGLVLSLVGWLACAAGAALAFAGSGLSARGWPAGRQRVHRRARLAGHEIVPTVVIILAAIGAAVAFAPSWDSYVLRTSFGTLPTVTAGNAFANPAPIIVGDVAVMVLLAVVIAAAAFWRPLRLGAALAAGAIIPMVAQAVSAMVQVSEPTSPLQLGFSQAQANSAGLTITNGLTPMFWVYCAFLGTLILLVAWMLLTPDSAPRPAPYYPGQPYPGQPYPGQPYPGQPYPGQPQWSSMPGPSDAAAPAAGGPGIPSHPAPQP